MSEERVKRMENLLSDEDRKALDQLHTDITGTREVLRTIIDLLTEPLGRLTRVLNADGIKNYLEGNMELLESTYGTRKVRPEITTPKVIEETGDDSKFFDFTDV